MYSFLYHFLSYTSMQIIRKQHAQTHGFRAVRQMPHSVSGALFRITLSKNRDKKRRSLRFFYPAVCIPAPSAGKTRQPICGAAALFSMICIFTKEQFMTTAALHIPLTGAVNPLRVSPSRQTSYLYHLAMNVATIFQLFNLYSFSNYFYLTHIPFKITVSPVCRQTVQQEPQSLFSISSSDKKREPSSHGTYLPGGGDSLASIAFCGIFCRDASAYRLTQSDLKLRLG